MSALTCCCRSWTMWTGARCQDWTKTEMCVERIADVTALQLACAKGMLKLCKALIKRGASKMSRDSWQRTPLMWAARGHLSVVVLLIGRPGKVKMTPDEVNAIDKDGMSAILFAAGMGDAKICGVLIQAGARLDLKSSTGHTPLMVAQEYQPTNAALLALLSGAGPAQLPGTVCDHCGKTAEQAKVKNLKECGKCYAARFCCEACLAAAWPGHKKECKARAEAREKLTKPASMEGPT